MQQWLIQSKIHIVYFYGDFQIKLFHEDYVYLLYCAHFCYPPKVLLKDTEFAIHQQEQER
jgi:hypothetical protein